MYINPFLAGVISTIFVEAIVTVVAAIISSMRDKGDDE